MGQLGEKREALSEVQIHKTVPTSELKGLRLRVEEVGEWVSVDSADVALQTLQQEENREQQKAKVANLEKVKSHLEVGNDDLAT